MQLSELDLNFSDKGPKFLHAAMKSVKLFRVKSLNLSDNLLDDEDAKYIAKVMKKNHKFTQYMDLSFN